MPSRTSLGQVSECGAYGAQWYIPCGEMWCRGLWRMVIVCPAACVAPLAAFGALDPLRFRARCCGGRCSGPTRSACSVSIRGPICRRFGKARRLRPGAVVCGFAMTGTPRIVPSVPDDMTKTLNARLRPLQRRLQEEGATSRALPGGGVRGVGVGRLAGTDGLLTEIAERFGFSDSPLFSRAFKRGTERLRTGFAVSPGRTAAASPDGATAGHPAITGVFATAASNRCRPFSCTRGARHDGEAVGRRAARSAVRRFRVFAFSFLRGGGTGERVRQYREI